MGIWANNCCISALCDHMLDLCLFFSVAHSSRVLQPQLQRCIRDTGAELQQAAHLAWRGGIDVEALCAQEWRNSSRMLLKVGQIFSGASVTPSR